MKLFQAYEIDIKTRRSKEEVIKGLKKKAHFKNDSFKIPSKIFSFRRGSKIEGEVLTKGELTVVKAKVLPSGDLKAFAFLFLSFGMIFLFGIEIAEIKQHKFNLEALLAIPGMLFAYGVMKIVFWISFQMQKTFIEYLILNDE